jgi:hypothetical protein
MSGLSIMSSCVASHDRAASRAAMSASKEEVASTHSTSFATSRPALVMMLACMLCFLSRQKPPSVYTIHSPLFSISMIHPLNP